MRKAIELKSQVVSEIVEKLEKSSSAIVVDYKGLTVEEVTELRKKMREAGVEYKVYKNTLIRKAFESLGINDFNDDLNGPTAVAFGTDETGAAKVIVDAAKKYQDKIVIKSAYFEEKRLDANGVKALGAIPSKQQLYGMLASALLGVPRALAIALNQVAEKNS